MARYTGAVCKLCRREGKKLFLLSSAERMLPASTARAARRLLNTVFSFVQSSRLSVTTVFRRASSTSISLWLSASRA